MSSTIKETINLLDEVVSIIREERPTEPAFENEDPEGWCSVLAWEEKASQAIADLLMVERRKNEKLQAENAELKKQSQRNDLSENWPLFLDWYGGYCEFDDSNLAWPVVQHSREDMRHAYQAGYEAAPPTPPEGE